MAVLTIAGSGRGAGKTAVGCALIAAFPQFSWTAVKISLHTHLEGPPLPIQGELAVQQELDRDSEKDTGRFLRAGAACAFLISGVREGAIAAVAAAIAALPGTGALLVESNRIHPRLIAAAHEPGASLAVLHGNPDQWKPSLRSRLNTVDAVVLTGNSQVARLPPDKRHFFLPVASWTTPELIEFLRSRLELRSSLEETEHPLSQRHS